MMLLSVGTKVGLFVGDLGLKVAIFVGLIVGDSVSTVVTFSVGLSDGCGVVGGLGFFVGCFVGLGVGRQFVNAMHFIVLSSHSVSVPDVQGW